MAYLGDKNVGDIVKIKENGTAVNFIIAHKGKPSSLYDSSCDGVWVVRETAHSQRCFNADDTNDYENSDIKAWLNGEYLNSIDIKDAIKQVKIPYKKGTGVQSGANGLSCKVFLLSGYEVGFTTELSENLPVDGAKLSYFTSATNRLCKYNNSNYYWRLRSALLSEEITVWYVASNGGTAYTGSAASLLPIRPTFVLPSSLLVDSSGNVSTNTPPTITSDKIGNLGTLTSGFTCKYSVNDADTADAVSVTLSMDSTTLKTFQATKGTQNTYSLAGNDWLKMTNGSHTFKISATDGKDTATSTVTFTRSVNKLTVTLESPLEADDRIAVCSLKVEGSIPADAVCTYEVTNNDNDSSPVWEECTKSVKDGFAYAFKNKVAENGFAFNFRIKIQRGASNTGGYITKISGGFE